MPKFLVDTDVFVDHLRNGIRIPVPPADSAYSSVTRAELYAGRFTDEHIVDTLLSAFEEIPVDRGVAEAAGRLRRENDISLPDALIAASAMSGRRQLITGNVRHFRSLPGLKLYKQR